MIKNMDEQLVQKKIWETPQIEELNIKETNSGRYMYFVENTWYYPS